MNPEKEICNAFNRHAFEYEQAAKVQNEIGERLFERLDYLKINPRYVLDLGCGTGVLSRRLKAKYPDACLVSLDLAYAMLKQTGKKQRLWRKWPLVNADMNQLPFSDAVFDLVFANQVIHWSEPLSRVIQELNRVMKAQGCLMFSTLGPDTFLELRQAFAGADGYTHTNSFADMHDVGDCLLSERFLDPVMDMERLTVHYPDLSALIHNLKAQGVRHINPARNPGLTGRGVWQAFEKGYQVLRTAEGKYPLSYEVVYGHAWKGEQRRVGETVETFVPISAIQLKK
ncbi:malonyl-ACP O-methyltransferase BioC [Legionella sp. CNM-4043-24]|uniref:malonyl-ACP O-methyltransferase BioC n=1 Tax=Legionella sp. CNM-4043-24 TaxID=3421646 RepID=UPI00403AAF47